MADFGPSPLPPPRQMAAPMRVRPIFAWYDLWIGAFYDRAKRRLYIFPIPCFGFYIEREGN